MEVLNYKIGDLEIKFNLRGPITLIQGPSSTGKSYIYEALKCSDIHDGLCFIDYNMIKGGTNDDALTNHLKTNAGLYVFIDQADEVLEKCPELEYTIGNDIYNTYIIIGRSVDIPLSPSSIASIKIENNMATLDYLLPDRDWRY